MIHFIPDHRPNEPDVAFDKDQALSLRDLEGRVVATVQAPQSGWSTADLHQAAVTAVGRYQCGIDAFVGDQWVGSTEV